MTNQFSILLYSITLLFAATGLYGCGNSNVKSATNFPDPDAAAYYITEQNLVYDLGTDLKWLIAPSENLPDQFDMCIIDTVNQVSVSVIELAKHTDFSGLSPEKIEKLVADITQSNLPAEFTVKENSIKPSKDKEEVYWEFATDITLKIEGEETEVLYKGKIFEGSKNVCAIVVTGQPQTQNLSEYINRLTQNAE